VARNAISAAGEFIGEAVNAAIDLVQGVIDAVEKLPDALNDLVDFIERFDTPDCWAFAISAALTPLGPAGNLMAGTISTAIWFKARNAGGMAAEGGGAAAPEGAAQFVRKFLQALRPSMWGSESDGILPSALEAQGAIRGLVSGAALVLSGYQCGRSAGVI